MVNKSLLVLALVATVGLLQAGTTEALNLGRSLLQANVTDADILNFALQLEYLEGNFYSYAAYGHGLEFYNLTGGGVPATGGKKANLTGQTQQYAVEIANDEIHHVQLLRSALGDAAVPQPAMDIGAAFAAAANAAFNTTLDPVFDPYANDLFFLLGAYLFEDVGVTAYKGAAALIADKPTLTVAAKILSTEAYHAGIIRSVLASQGAVVTPYGVTVAEVTQGISALRAAASNDTAIDTGVTVTGADFNLVPTDDNGLVFSRTVPQVLSVVYLGSSEKVGGFFPSGIVGLFGPK